MDDLDFAISHQNETVMLRCIKQGQHIGRERLTLHNALFWAKGVQLLIRAGIDINDTRSDLDAHLEFAVLLKQAWLHGAFETTKILLDSGADIYDPDTIDKGLTDEIWVVHPQLESILSWSLTSRDDRTIRLCVEEMGLRRQALKQLALEVLPRLFHEKLGLLKDSLPDAQVWEVLDALHSEGQEVPRKLFVPKILRNRRRQGEWTVYNAHDMTAHTAQLLWEAGFRDIQTIDSGISHRGYDSFRGLEYVELAAWFRGKEQRPTGSMVQ